MNYLTMSLFVLCLALAMPAPAQPMTRVGTRSDSPEESVMSQTDKTLSPYFAVLSDDPNVDRLPLLSTRADVTIAGVIADVRVTQVYKNEGKKPIEAIYTFPASTRAAVYAMKMTIGDRTIVAKIREREQARQEYEAARQRGQSASLLEQQRPNVFQMNVANVMPGDVIRVEMSYTELLVPTDGIYEFAYPTVVGPRYNNKTAAESPASERWIASPYTHEGEEPTYTFDIALALESGLPIQDISCPSHKTSVKFTGLKAATVRLDKSEKAGGNRDFILRYRLSGGRIQSGLLLSEGKDENFFLLMLQPPKRVQQFRVPPREYIFVVDVSGSMHGFPLDISKSLMRNLFANLRPRDYFNVLLFSGDNAVLSERSLPATKANLEKAIALIDAQSGGGGTELLPALKRALSLPRAKGTSRNFVIATDGYVTVETEAFDLIRKSLGEANFFAFGIGSSVNRYIIEGMARVGMGEPFVITRPDGAAAQAEKFRKYIATPVLTDIRVSFPGFEAYDVEPERVPDVLAERPIVICGKWRGGHAGAIRVTGRTPQGPYSQTVSVADVAPDRGNSALRYLWARQRIQLLADYNNIAEDKGRVKEVTQLGLKYNLLTRYTSFVAVDRKIRNVGGRQEVVEQPLPMPQGVSDYAVGDGAAVGYSGKSVRALRSAPSAVPAEAMQELRAEERAVGGRVRVAKVEAKGSLGNRAARASVEKLLGDLEVAYQSELAADAGLAGQVEVTFLLRPDGKTAEVKVLRNELNPAIERAVRALVARLVAQKSVSVTSIRVVFEFGS